MKEKSQPKIDSTTLSRRRFLTYGIGTVGAALGLSYLGLMGNFVIPKVATAADTLQKVGSVAEFPLDTPTLVSYNGAGTEEGVYLINQGAEGFIALDFHCTHLQCAVSWVQASKQFICPCHGGQFDIQGKVLGGPPPQPLHRRIVKIEGDNVLIGGRQA